MNRFASAVLTLGLAATLVGCPAATDTKSSVQIDPANLTLVTLKVPNMT